MLEGFFELIENNDSDYLNKSLSIFTLRARKLIKSLSKDLKSNYNIIQKNFDSLFIIIQDFNPEYFCVEDYEFFDINEYNSYINFLIKVFEKK